MRQHFRVWILAAALVACAAPVFQHTRGAPRLPPSDAAQVVERAPIGGVLIGTAEIQATVYQTGEECQAAVLEEAKKAGASHVVIRPGIAATASRGPRCRAEAYYVPQKR